MATTALPNQMESETEGEFEVFRSVPVFDEHEGDDGVNYDKRLLECIAGNNNYRIDDTGDFCPIVAGHTPGSEEGQQPEIVGYAGPFKVSVIGNKDPRHCIYADFRIHKQHADTFRRNPRRSVELWPEESPEKRFFDPIAILGAETPKRALGMTRYRATSRTKQPIRYEMGAEPATAEAGGHNTYIPTAGKKKKPQTFNLEGSNMTPEEIAQLMASMQPMMQAMIDDTLNAQLGNDAAEEALADLPEDGAPPAGMPTEALPEPGPMSLTPDEPLTPEIPTAAPDALAGELDPAGPVVEEDEKPSPFMKYAHGKMMQYMCDDKSEHKTEAMDYCQKFANGLDDSDSAMMPKVMAGGSTDEEKDFYAKMAYAMKDKYAKLEEEDATTTKKDEHPSKGDDKDYGKDTKPDITQRYRKTQAENRKLAARNAELETEARADRAAAKYAKRSQTLDSLSQEYIMPAEEIDHCASMTDDQFEAHVDHIPLCYQKVRGPELSGFATAPSRTPVDTQADATSAVARDAVLKYRKEMPRLTFREAFKNVEANDGKFVLPDGVKS